MPDDAAALCLLGKDGGLRGVLYYRNEAHWSRNLPMYCLVCQAQLYLPRDEGGELRMYLIPISPLWYCAPWRQPDKHVAMRRTLDTCRELTEIAERVNS